MKNKSTGQAAVEYLFVLVFMVLIASKISARFNTFFRDSIGNLGHVLSQNLSVGVCKSNCFFAGYGNGYTGAP
ncbi:MAG: hypothetical protein K2P81_04485 [Bacteriovoracaceae bacterium]|nr:hypothetical protein [Bacteriovoracaceae bacterium]